MPELRCSSRDLRSLLIVEDEYLIAIDLANWVQDLGIQVIGPVGSVREALEAIKSAGRHLHGALLDVNVRGEPVYPVADALAARGVPFLFTTGYDALAIPSSYLETPRLPKPVDRARLARWLSEHLHAGQYTAEGT
jgi:CheY-like chemotaxis protein